MSRCEPYPLNKGDFCVVTASASREAAEEGQIKLVLHWQRIDVRVYYAIRQKEDKTMFITVSKKPDTGDPCLGNMPSLTSWLCACWRRCILSW